MADKHRGMALRRARELASIEDTVHLEGFGWGQVMMYGNDPADVRTWFEIEHLHLDKTCPIHPAQVAHIDGLRTLWKELFITLKEIRAIDMIVDFRSGEVLAHKDDILDAETACRLLYFVDEFRGSAEGIPPDFQMGVTWEWVDNTEKEA